MVSKYRTFRQDAEIHIMICRLGQLVEELYITRSILRKFKRALNKLWKSKLIKTADRSRRESVAMATGHDCLAAHLHTIGIYEDPKYNLCSSIMEA